MSTISHVSPSNSPFRMLIPILKVYGRLELTAKTIAPPPEASQKETAQSFWNPENATIGDAFFELPSITLTADKPVQL